MDLIKEVENIQNEEFEFEGEETLNPANELNELYPLESIKIDAGQYSVYELKRKYDRIKKQNNNENNFEEVLSKGNQIILNSPFQREEVWSPQQQAELIESVLMGLPIPLMYLFEDRYANLIVVDGRQRLTAFFEFLDDKLKLTKLKVLSDLNGLSFSDLNPIYQSKLEDYQLFTQVIKPPTPDAIKFQIFDRVNRGGTALNNQEMRNALYQGKSTNLLERLSKNEGFVKATNKSLSSKRMKDKYIILRSLAFYLYFDMKLSDIDGQLYEYKGDIDEFLGRTMEFLNSLTTSSILKLEDKFNLAMNNAYRIFGNDAFRLASKFDNRKSPINMNLFEMMLYVLINLGEEESLDKEILGIYNNLINNNDFLENIGNHRDSNKKVNERLTIIKQRFGGVIKFD